MPQSPSDRRMALQRELEASQQRLADMNAYQAQQEQQWAVEDAKRKEEDRLARQARKLQKEADKKEREGRKKEKLRNGRAPPREQEPIFFSGNTKPKKTRYVCVPLHQVFPWMCLSVAGFP